MSIRRLTTDFLILLGGNTVSQTIVFLTFIMVAKQLSIDEFGRFAFAQAAVNFMTRLAEFGLETVAVRRLSSQEHSPQLFERVSTLRLGITMSLIAPLYLLWWSGYGGGDVALIAVLSLSMIPMSFSVEWFFLGTSRMWVVSTIRVVRALAMYLPLLFFIENETSATAIAWLFVVSVALINGCAVFLVFTTLRSSLHQGNGEYKEILREAAPIGVAGALMQVPYYFGTFIIGLLSTQGDVAVYSAAQRPLLAVWSFGIMALYNAIFPTMNAVVVDRDGFKRLLIVFTRFFSTAAIIFIGFMYPLGNWLIQLLYGGRYSEGGVVFQYYSIIIAIVLSRVAMEYALVSLKRQNEYLIGISTVSLLYVVFCTIGTIQFGVMGMVIGALMSEVVYTGYIVVLVSRILVMPGAFSVMTRTAVVIIALVSVGTVVQERGTLVNVGVMLVSAIVMVVSVSLVGKGSLDELRAIMRTTP